MKKTNEELKQLLLNGTKEKLIDIADTIHPVDILDIIQEDSENAKLYLKNLPTEMIADIIEESETEDQYEILQYFLEETQKEILDEMSNDEITDLLGELDLEEQKELLEKIGYEDRVEIKKLLEFDPESAGGIMATEYIDIHANNTVKQTLEFLQTNTEEDATYYLYVVDKQNVLKGVVSLRDIVTSTFDTPILDITNTNVKTLMYDTDQEEVANTFRKYGFILMPVVDEQNHLLGVVHFDDIMDVMEEETTEDIHLLGGVNSEERINSSVIESYRSRVPWLIINLATATIAASVVNAFQTTIDQVVFLAVIMPVVAGLGGNSGTQSLTIVVRALSLGEITRENAARLFFKEIRVGILNGVTVGLIAAFASSIVGGSPYFGIVTGCAMFFNMFISTIGGFFVPLIFKKCNIDPALASSIFVTMLTDTLGFLFFLGLATMFIQQLSIV